MSSFYNLSIAAIKKEASKAISISFNVPESLKETFSFKAGQYITIKTNLDSK